MSDIQKFRDWISSFAHLPQNIRIDKSDEFAGTGLFPDGLQEVDRRKNIHGVVTITNRLNFVLHITQPFNEFKEQDNAEWVHELQQWVQEQSALGLAPIFGNFDTENEVMQAENGALYKLPEKDGSVATYAVQVGVTYKMRYGG